MKVASGRSTVLTCSFGIRFPFNRHNHRRVLSYGRSITDKTASAVSDLNPWLIEDFGRSGVVDLWDPMRGSVTTKIYFLCLMTGGFAMTSPVPVTTFGGIESRAVLAASVFTVEEACWIAR